MENTESREKTEVGFSNDTMFGPRVKDEEGVYRKKNWANVLGRGNSPCKGPVEVKERGICFMDLEKGSWLQSRVQHLFSKVTHIERSRVGILSWLVQLWSVNYLLFHFAHSIPASG